MAAFSRDAFSTDAFSESAFDFGAVVSSVDTHDGFDGKKHHDGRKRKERLHNQLEEAFYDAFGGRPVLPPVMARNDEPLQEFVFPAYRESPVVDEDDEEAAALLLTT